MNYRVAIIGAGKIGATLDYPQSPLVLTHAHGYTVSEGFEIVGFVDSDLAKAEAASARWGGAAFRSIENLLATQSVDIVSVCLPDELHYQALVALAGKALKFIFLEKPAVSTLAEADEVRLLYRELPIRVQVNYTRRFVPEIRSIQAAIRSGKFGKFLTGVGYYGKGLRHNGSHMIDMLQFFLGEIRSVEQISELKDFYDHDPSVSARLSMVSGGDFHLCHIDCSQFHIFELDLTFESKRIRIRDLGTVVEEYSVGNSPVIEGLRTLHKSAEYSTQHSVAIRHAIANIRGNLDKDEALLCTLEESLMTVEACAKIARETTA